MVEFLYDFPVQVFSKVEFRHLANMEEFLYDFPVQVFSKAEFRHLANMEEEKIQGTPVQKKLVCQAKQLLSEGYIPKNRQVYLSLPFIHNIQRGGKLFSNIQEDIENQNLKIKT